MKCVHVAPLHRRDDVRVLVKECASLASEGHDVTLVVADGGGDDVVRSVEILDTGPVPSGKFMKRLAPLYRSARQARRMRPDIIHFHDGMFLPFAIVLALLGDRVIYDVHEDYPRQVMNQRFPYPVKKMASVLYTALEWVGSKVFSGIVAATPHIARRFPEGKTITVQNFAILEALLGSANAPYDSRDPKIAYVGGLAVHRGAEELMLAMGQVRHPGATLELAGSFSPEALEQQVRALPGWEKVNFRRWLGREEVADLLSNSRAGIVTFLPAPNHVEAQPNKMFEYMSAGLPVIASDFPLWREIIDLGNCGVLVDPLDPAAIARAIDWILDNPAEAGTMGERGRQAVIETYNWETEAKKLLQFYNSPRKN